LRQFLEGDPSEIVLKVGVLAGAVMKKSKKHCARAALGSQVTRLPVKSSFLEHAPGAPSASQLGGIGC